MKISNILMFSKLMMSPSWTSPSSCCPPPRLCKHHDHLQHIDVHLQDHENIMIIFNVLTFTSKIVDGSFAALFNDDDVVVDFSKKLKTMQRDCSESSIILIINVIITDIFIVIILLIILIISIPYLSVACSSSPRFHSSTLKTVQSHNFPTTKIA